MITHISAQYFLVASTIGLFLAAILFSRHKSNFSNKLFASVITIVSMEVLRKYFLISGITNLGIKALSIFTISAQALIGPLLLIYTLSITSNKNTFSINEVKHVIHFLTVFVLYSLLQFTLDSIVLIFVLRISIIVAGFLYAINSVKILISYRTQIKEIYSNIDKFRLKWLNHFLGIILIFYLINMIFIALVTFNLVSTKFYEFSNIVQLFIILIASVFVIRQPNIFGSAEKVDLENNTYSKETNSKYFSGKGISENKSKIIYEKVLEIMEKEKPYLNEELKLNDLAKLLNVQSHHLSAAINKNGNVNFYRFINSYRVDEVKEKLKNDNMQTNLLAIALESGFSSKSSFNRIFKEITGNTPSSYQKKQSNI